TIVYHAGLVLALSLSVRTTSMRYCLKPIESHSPNRQGLEAIMNVLSSCAEHNPSARHFYQVLHYFRQSIDNCEDARAVHTSQTDGCELFGPCHASSIPSSSQVSTVATRGPISAMWQTSSDVPSSMFSYPYPSLSGVSAGLNTTILPNNDLPLCTMTNYVHQSIPDTTCAAWAASLPSDGSKSSLIGGSSSQWGFVDAEFENYKPYVQNF
ncbi:hypothetical protein LTR43_012207, partial [Exophiala xenobiotica]